jgi:hypothetical protein
MGYAELAPPPELASHVACLWISSGSASGLVLPDGCVDLVWTGTDLRVAGPSTQAFVAPSTSDEPRVGIRLRVGAAGTAIGQPAAELLNASPRLADIWRDGDEVTERVALSGAKLRTLAECLAKRLVDAEPIDREVRGAVVALARPGARVAGTAELLSDRQLRRRFATSVGYPPKTLAGVLRLQRFLHLARSGASLAELAHAAGYADQSHLGREALRLTGLTPRALLTRHGPAGEGELNPG